MTRKTTLIATLAVPLLIAIAGAQVRLEVKRTVATTTTRKTNRSSQVLTLAGMELPTKAESVVTSTTTNHARAADGTQRITEKIDGMKVNLDLPGGLKVTFDSDKPDTPTAIPQLDVLVQMFRALTGATYTMVTGKDDRAVSIEGVEQVIANAPAAATEALRAHFKPEQLKREHDQEIQRFPKEPVKVGDRWRREEPMDIGGGQTMTFVTYYEYQGTVTKDGKTLDKIGIFNESVTYALEENPQSPFKVVRSDLKIIESTGTILFDRAAGQMVHHTTSVHIMGPMTFSINNMELPGNVDLTMEMETVVVGKK